MRLSYVASMHAQPGINWYKDMTHESGDSGQRTPHSDKESLTHGWMKGQMEQRDTQSEIRAESPQEDR